MSSRLLAAILLVAVPAAAQPVRPSSAPAAAATPAPMPDPLVSPDLQAAKRKPTLSEIVQQSAWQDPVIAAARDQYKALPGSCTAATFKPTGQLVLYAPTRFAPDGNLAQGMWSESVNVSGCAPLPDQLNVLTVVQPGGLPARIPTMPGNSHADPETQKNALQYAQAIALRAAPQGCVKQTFTDAQFDDYTGLPNPEITDGRDNRAWRENWYLAACGATYVIQITFTPNARGFQLSATNPIKHP